MEHLQHLAEQVFPNHYTCWNARADIVALHAIGDGLTALSYYLIPVLLYYATRRYHFDIRLKFIFLVYAAFIFLCGTTHLIDTLMIWYVTESILIFDGCLRIVTGAFSLFSAGVTFYAVLRFTKYVTRVFGITVQMAKERREFSRVHNETWESFAETISEARRFLHRGDSLEEQ